MESVSSSHKHLYPRGTYDAPATISIFAFAIAIPFLASKMMLRYLLTERKAPETTASIFLYVVGRIASVIGIAAAFWHVSWIADVVIYTKSK